jgi:hypothetical protein
MPSKVVADAFEARLATWPNLASCPLVDLNEVSDAPIVPPYLEIEYPVAAEERMSVGVNAIYRERGGARFVITVAAFELGWKDQVLTWCDELRDLFRGRFLDNGVETFEASPAVIDERNRDGTKFSVPFVVLYKFDALKAST